MTGYNHYSHCNCGWCVKRRTQVTMNWGIRDAKRILRGLNYREGSFASCFVNPNAQCRVCGERVFFYANALGSRVFFNDLGPPWTKHGCMDRGRVYAIRNPDSNTYYPPMRRRNQGEIDEISEASMALGDDPRTRYHSKYEIFPPSVFVVAQAVRQGLANYIKADELVGGEGQVGYFKFTSANFEVAAGDIFAVDFSTEPGTISFPDLSADKATPRRLKVWIVLSEEFNHSATGSNGAGSRKTPQ